jgi:hypothetical protein
VNTQAVPTSHLAAIVRPGDVLVIGINNPMVSDEWMDALVQGFAPMEAMGIKVVVVNGVSCMAAVRPDPTPDPAENAGA